MRCIAPGSAFERAAVTPAIERCLEGEQGGNSLDARRMSTSTSACYGFVAYQPRRPARKAAAHTMFGSVAVASLMLCCAWTLYANVFGANVYPTLSSASFD